MDYDSSSNLRRDWADDARGWLRRCYQPDSTERHFELTAGRGLPYQQVAVFASFGGGDRRLAE